MNKLVVDSSVFVSLFGKADTFTESSASFFNNLPRDTEIILPAIVVAETLVNLAKQKLPTKAVYDKLLKFTIVPLDGVFLEKFRQLLGDGQMRSADLIIAATAKLNTATLISWDKRHLSKANDICEALTPKQYLSQVDLN